MKTSPAGSTEVKRRNRANTLRCILSCEHISQMELGQRLGLSWPTVLQNVKELAGLGLVADVGQYESTGGRKAKAYAPVRDARLAVGLDLTGNHVGAALVDLSGQLVRYQRKALRFSLDEGYMRELARLVRDIVGDGEEKLLGVGISLPGIVDNAARLLRYSRVPGLRELSTDAFSRALPWPCGFINDANAAALAELYGLPGAGNLVYLSLSGSVGGAIVTGGTLYTGEQLRAGEFGHTTLIPGGRPCHCGKSGCLDAYCSARVLSEGADGSLAAFFYGLRSGDAAKRALWQEYLERLAIAVNNLHMGFDCDVIVGGHVGAFMEEFGQGLRPLLAERNSFGPDSSYLKFCRYKLEASAVGAALTQVERFLREV